MLAIRASEGPSRYIGGRSGLYIGYNVIGFGVPSRKGLPKGLFTAAVVLTMATDSPAIYSLRFGVVGVEGPGETNSLPRKV